MELGTLYLPAPVALAAVAALGYLVGRRRREADDEPSARSRRELRRARHVAGELEKIAAKLRESLSAHNARLLEFRQKVDRLSSVEAEAAFSRLCAEAEEILKPTMRLAAELSAAQDELRQQSSNLMSFTETRTDPLTGVQNRRGLDDALSAQMALLHRYDVRFSLVLFDIDHFKQINDQRGHLRGDELLRELATKLDESARETDFVARYGGEEFVVVMPQTDLFGACIFAERMRVAVAQQLSLTISGGVAEALDGDSAESLLARADEALYAAKAGGRNCVFCNDGQSVQPICLEPAGG